MYLIQHGWGKGERITSAVQDGDCDGVVAGACDESPVNLESLIKTMRDAGLTALIDPQFYVFPLPQPNLKHLAEYPYTRPGIRPSDFSAREVTSIVSDCLGYQASLPVTALLSPTVMQGSFNDSWSQIAVTLAAESIEWARGSGDDRTMYCSLLIGEETLSERDNVDEFLDSLTELECDGFYIVVSRSSSTYDLSLQTQRLANLLTIIYSLAELNEYEVLVGYADYSGVVYRAVGAVSFASGWYRTLRRFHTDRWLGGPGGRQPLPRYASRQLVNDVLLETELRTIADRGRLADVIGATAREQKLHAADPRMDQAGWTPDDAHRQHFHVCRELDNAVSGPLVQRLRASVQLIEAAMRLYADLSGNEGVLFTPETGPRHLGMWLAAVNDFAASAGISL